MVAEELGGKFGVIFLTFIVVYLGYKKGKKMWENGRNKNKTKLQEE